MSDHDTLSRRALLGGSVKTALLAGVAVAGGAATVDVLGGATPSRAAEDGGEGFEVKPGELDQYYGIWSSGQTGELRIVGVPSMRELMRVPSSTAARPPAGASPTRASRS